MNFPVSIICTAVAAHFLALLSPGPDFLLVVKSGIRSRNKNAFGIAFGIASANGIYIWLCIMGIGKVLSQSILLMNLLKIFGGIFLLYIALCSIKTRRQDYSYINADIHETDKISKGFLYEFSTGFISGITNPKNLLFYLSLFSLVLTEDVSIYLKLILGFWMILVVFLWDGFIILLLSQRPSRECFSRISFYVDKIAGGVLGFTGLSIIKSIFY